MVCLHQTLFIFQFPSSRHHIHGLWRKPGAVGFAALKESSGAFGRTAQIIIANRKYDNMPILKKNLSHITKTLYAHMTLTWRCVRWLMRLFYVCTASWSQRLLTTSVDPAELLKHNQGAWYCCEFVILLCVFYELILHNNHKAGEMLTGSFIVTSLCFLFFVCLVSVFPPSGFALEENKGLWGFMKGDQFKCLCRWKLIYLQNMSAEAEELFHK